MENIINLFLIVLAGYFAIGLLFGIYFVFIGATKIDPLLKESKKIVRVLLLPGTVATWPFFIKKLFKTKST
jgi:L-cystine uptake protein TcyP (sodium:dicarboxylate symporter family)